MQRTLKFAEGEKSATVVKESQLLRNKKEFYQAISNCSFLLASTAILDIIGKWNSQNHKKKKVI